MRVVVVGAGLGGLCVANGLLRAGFQVEVLEAREQVADAGQGYRINVNADGHRGLRACLDDEHFAAYERTLHRQSDPGVYLYAPDLRLVSRHEAPPAPGAIDRGTVRRILADAVAGRIRFGRRVRSLADVGDADLVVAADGVNSVLRKELLPGAEPRRLGWSAIFGRAPLTAANRPWLSPTILHSRFCGVVDKTTVLALCAYDPPNGGSYVMWVLMGPSGELPRDGDLVRFAVERTAGWDKRAVAILRESVADDSFLAPLRAMPEIPPIPERTPVAFLGDAIHAMSPAAGEGANTALADAGSLVAQLTARDDPADAVSAYHKEMRVRAGAALERSARLTSAEVSHA
ncbi:FAD-dependent monooxygenase [Fodinicola acaciae]|uniref:FAD-dependent monooxygenase n=1 Tax=Fodinicola acaciae TaxID=2681555 RepID=UPI0013D5D240|nr:NAD(P)/FAD-dependent oxidoreductase [Fodinicola acaciae]